jgi:UTP--glucose-1-phosphate uridylyltransferase
MSIRKAVIPVSGFGTRLLPTTRALPKEMLPVGRYPTIRYVVEEMISAGAREILFVTSRSKTIIEDEFDNQSPLIAYLAQEGKLSMLGDFDYQARGISFAFIRQQSPPGVLKPQGTGAAIAAAESFVGNEPFIVAYGDTIIDSDPTPNYISRIVASHIAHQPACAIGVRRAPRESIHLYGVVKPASNADVGSGDFEISDIVEKPAPAEAPSLMAVNARYIFTPEIFEEIRKVPLSKSGEIPITTAIQNLIRQGKHVRCVTLAEEETRYDLGNHEDYYRAFIDFALRDPDYGERIRGYIEKRVKNAE